MDPLFWALILLAVGIVLLVAEFFLPSGGALAVASAGAIVAALVIPFFAEQGAWWRASVVLLVALVCVPATLRLTIDLWPRSAFGRLLLIDLPKQPEDVLPPEAVALKELVGRVGVARSPMRPSGTVAIDNVYYPALSEGMPIEKGDRVKTIAVRMRQLVVVPARDADLVAAEMPSPARRTPTQAPAGEPRPAEAVAPAASALADPEPRAPAPDALRQSDDLAASIEALEIFAAEQEAARSSDADDASAPTPRPADR